MLRLCVVGVGTVLVSAWAAAPAQAINLTISGSDFNSGPLCGLAGTCGTGTVAGTLNTTAFPNGFGSFFTTPYGRLGATNAQQATGGIGFGISTLSTTFTLAGADLTKPLKFTFDYAFAGNSGTNDTFGALLFRPGTIVPVGVFSTNTLTSGVTGQVAFVDDSLFTTAGTYTLTFGLIEAIGGGNSAAGFDNVSIRSVPVPPGVAGTLLLGLLTGRKLRQRAKTQA
ncbi:MAG: hypothetical protein IGQ88_03420 [Gloeomargaritaceae cyanobacterium C42_A2020_066]|nr:hypothetical protein [Gloeomargaritaceae cyanobacterium C42_A2020_066]